MKGNSQFIRNLHFLPAVCLIWASFLAPNAPVRAEPIPVPGIATVKPATGPFVKLGSGYMVPYKETIPGTDINFDMVPISGGEFLLGSPNNEASRKEDEGPQARVAVSPFWMGKHEVTWREYRAYMSMYEVFKQLQRLATSPISLEEKKAFGAAWLLIEKHSWHGDPKKDWGVDAVTSATPLYDPSFNYSAGEKPDQPAVTMTQFAARQYTKWLSGITGQEFRLPRKLNGSTPHALVRQKPSRLEQIRLH